MKLFYRNETRYCDEVALNETMVVIKTRRSTCGSRIIDQIELASACASGDRDSLTNKRCLASSVF